LGYLTSSSISWLLQFSSLPRPLRPSWQFPSGVLHFRERLAAAKTTRFGAFLSVIAAVMVPSLISNSPWRHGHFRSEETITVCIEVYTICSLQSGQVKGWSKKSSLTGMRLNARSVGWCSTLNENTSFSSSVLASADRQLRGFERNGDITTLGSEILLTYTSNREQANPYRPRRHYETEGRCHRERGPKLSDPWRRCGRRNASSGWTGAAN